MKESPTEVITLSNGIRLAYVRSNSAVGHLAFYFKGGSRSEPSTHPGLAHFLEHCIFKEPIRAKPCGFLPAWMR